MPFLRPCGAIGNDAQKLHAPAFAAFLSAARMHGVLCHHITALPIRQELFAPAPRCESEDAPDADASGASRDLFGFVFRLIGAHVGHERVDGFLDAELAAVDDEIVAARIAPLRVAVVVW